MPKDTSKPRPRDYAIAQNLLMGQTPTAAVRNAGYSPKTASVKGWRMAKHERVKQAMLEIARGIQPGDLGGMAKAMLEKELIEPPENARERVQIIRLALEADGMVGQKDETHLHVHNAPPILQQMFEATLRKLKEQDEREKALVPIAEVVNP